MEKHVNSLLGASVDKIKEMVDVNTVVGNPMTLGDGLTIIPVSRISYGFASGGSDLPNKAGADIFGGGAGAGINVTPVAFLVVRGNDVQLLPVMSKPTSIDHAISMVPGMVDKVTGLFKKDETVVANDVVAPVSEIVIEE